MNDFTLEGEYRVQSRRAHAPGVLEGDWYRAPGLVDNVTINQALQTHPSWRGGAQVRLRPALVSRREGKFLSEPDILYKRALFVPAAGSQAMAADMVDVLKAQQFWKERGAHVGTVLGNDCAAMRQALRDLALTIANEYVMHEAGHFLAYDVLAKQRDGYFTAAGKTIWPLVYLEELRADLNAFGFAARLLPAEHAVQIFFYNLMLRFGVHRQGILRQQLAPYGLVPYLLFHVLHTIGFVRVRESGGRPHLQLAGTRPAEVLAAMRACAAHAETQLNRHEGAACPRENAVTAARYLHTRLHDAERADAFGKVMHQACAEEEGA